MKYVIIKITSNVLFDHLLMHRPVHEIISDLPYKITQKKLDGAQRALLYWHGCIISEHNINNLIITNTTDGRTDTRMILGPSLPSQYDGVEVRYTTSNRAFTVSKENLDAKIRAQA